MKRTIITALIAGLLSFVFPANHATSQDAQTVQNPSKAARKAANNFQFPDRYTVKTYASEPLLQNPVTFTFDRKGRIYVGETHRWREGINDNRDHWYWLMDDLSSRTTQDRLEKFQKWAEKGKQPMSYYRRHSEKIRRIQDTDDDGVAEKSNVFASGFDSALAGPMAGLLFFRDDLYATSIPYLWGLQDQDGDGTVDQKEKLHSGFGVRTSLSGHDLHGLALGPDGRIYFSIGDRGYNVKTENGRRLTSYMDEGGRGAIFRMEPDGSNLEVVHRGLRNPQELAFDKYGNLFTVDNDSDAKDDGRLVYVVEGGDSGWMMSYQYMGRWDNTYNSRGAWDEEGLWKTQFEQQPKWIVPPIDHPVSGPAGLTYYPGTGFSNALDGQFFICDFQASPKSSGIHTFSVEQDGASFDMDMNKKFLWNVAATDVEFGYDGKMYVLDWISGWGMPGKGRIYSLYDPKQKGDDSVKQVQKIFQRGIRNQSVDRLASFLTHPDRRVRLRAHIALAHKGKKGVQALRHIALDQDKEVIPRLHGIWGLGIVGRRHNAEVLQVLEPLLQAEQDEIRAQVLRVMGEANYRPAAKKMTKLLSNSSMRVRYFAAQALADLEYPQALEPIVTMVRKHAGSRPYIRHAAVMFLKEMSVDRLQQYADDSSPVVRTAIALAYRHKQDSRIARFLNDPNTDLVATAARAIYDLKLDDAMPELAGLLNQTDRVLGKSTTSDSDRRFSFTVKYWNGYSGSPAGLTTGKMDQSADETATTSVFASEENRGDQYGTRITGTITPKQSGKYRFYIASDDASKLYLSRSGRPADKQPIASVSDWTKPYDWSDEKSQESKPISLEKGKTYYLEAVHVEGTGDDLVAVGWKRPDGTFDRPIGSGKDKGFSGSTLVSDAIFRRAMNANFQLRDAQYLRNVIQFVQNANVRTKLRKEAIRLLKNWSDPEPIERVLGLYRPVDAIKKSKIKSELQEHLPSLLSSTSGGLQSAVTELASAYDLKADQDFLLRILKDSNRSASARVEALVYLVNNDEKNRTELIKKAISSEVPELRIKARELLAKHQPKNAFNELCKAVNNGTLRERQNALDTMASLPGKQVDEFLADGIQTVRNGSLDLAIQLDLLQAARQRSAQKVENELSKYEQSLSEDDPLDAYRVALQGGHPDEGRKIFLNHSAAQCVRCHQINGTGGNAGPDLSDIGERRSREYILESMVRPNAEIASGFKLVTVQLKNGKTVSGTVQEQTDDTLAIAKTTGEVVRLEKQNIQEKNTTNTSSMPSMESILSKEELRDLVSYLSSLDGSKN